jgi:hypothetical protein
MTFRDINVVFAYKVIFCIIVISASFYAGYVSCKGNENFFGQPFAMVKGVATPVTWNEFLQNINRLHANAAIVATHAAECEAGEIESLRKADIIISNYVNKLLPEGELSIPCGNERQPSNTAAKFAGIEPDNNIETIREVALNVKINLARLKNYITNGGDLVEAFDLEKVDSLLKDAFNRCLVEKFSSV